MPQSEQSTSFFTEPSSPPLPPISHITISIDGETAQILNDAERAIRSFDTYSGDQLTMRVFASACQNIEAISDITMSDRHLTSEQIFRSNILQVMKSKRTHTDEKSEVLKSSNAVSATVELGKHPITEESFIAIHRELLSGTTRESFVGKLRTTPKQIGGTFYRPFGSSFSAPDPSEIPLLLKDLAQFCNQETMPAIAQAALAHIQFLGINPYERANGKTARAVIHLIFHRRRLISSSVVPVSLAFAMSRNDYRVGTMQTLQALASEGASPESINVWLKYFAHCCLSATQRTMRFCGEASELTSAWRTKLNARSDSASNLLITSLPAIPVFTAETAALYIDRSFKRTATAIEELKEAGIIVQVTPGKRNRVFEAPEIVKLYSGFEGMQ